MTTYINAMDELTSPSILTQRTPTVVKYFDSPSSQTPIFLLAPLMIIQQISKASMQFKTPTIAITSNINFAPNNLNGITQQQKLISDRDKPSWSSSLNGACPVGNILSSRSHICLSYFQACSGGPSSKLVISNLQISSSILALNISLNYP